MAKLSMLEAYKLSWEKLEEAHLNLCKEKDELLRRLRQVCDHRRIWETVTRVRQPRSSDYYCARMCYDCGVCEWENPNSGEGRDKYSILSSASSTPRTVYPVSLADFSFRSGKFTVPYHQDFAPASTNP